MIADRVAPENCRHTASAFLMWRNIGDDMLTQERLKQLFVYDPDTGVFTRLKASGRGKAGSQAGTISLNGYRAITVDRKRHQAHRLVFLYMTGELPESGVDVDHINGIRDDNRWANLRMATRAQNMWNSHHSSCGYYCKQTGKYAVKVKCNGVHHWVGRFDTKEQARQAYLNKVQQLHGDFASHE
jgi:hypothetical protein